MSVSEDDVVWCYQSILERSPESRDAVLKHANSALNLRTLVLDFIGSDEFRSRTRYPKTTQALMESIPEVHRADLFKGKTKHFDYKRISLDMAFRDITIRGDWAEFGVYMGDCARLMHKSLPASSSLHLFDSFDGLPEDWIGKWGKGAFAIEEASIPAFSDSRVKVVRGLFADSLPRYFGPNADPLAFIHMDADLYTSTLDALQLCNSLIVPGTVILFDEYVMDERDDEHHALIKWASERDRQFTYLWRTKWVQVAIRITQ